MEELLNEEEQIMRNELERANKNHPLFSSPHEAYAVIKEEAEEAEFELECASRHLLDFWYLVKFNKKELDMCKCLFACKESAMNLAAEAVQVAAMAQKAIDSLGKGK